jgi:hypothetical protein
MAIVRCEKHPVHQKLCKHKYAAIIPPVGYPQTAAICGSKNCLNPGKVWLRDDELELFEQGQCYFNVNTQSVKIQVSETGLLRL